MASYTVVVASRDGRVVSTVRANSALATWTRDSSRRGHGVTVRTDNRPASDTLRFENSVIVDANTVDTLF